MQTLENLLRMRPAGVVSKNHIGALATWYSTLNVSNALLAKSSST